MDPLIKGSGTSLRVCLGDLVAARVNSRLGRLSITQSARAAISLLMMSGGACPIDFTTVLTRAFGDTRARMRLEARYVSSLMASTVSHPSLLEK